MAERNPVDDLAALWERLEPEAATSDEADALDPTTAASVAWMRTAWAALEPPVEQAASRGALLHCDRAEEPPRPLTPRAVALLIAAVLLLVLLPRVLQRERDDAPRDDGALAEAVPERVQADPVEHAAPRPPYTPNALERRHGSVRLILLDDPARTAPEVDPEPNPETLEADDR